MTRAVERIDEREGRRVRLVLSRPKANILDAEMVAALRDEIAKLRDEPDVKLVVFEGAGSHFSFGASVEEHLPDNVAGMLAGFHGMFRELEALGVPTAALVRGQCLGGGLELALFCGRVFAEPSARFAVPEVKLAVFPPMGALVLPWRVGGARATQMIITGETVDAEQAAREGLIEQCDADADTALEGFYEAEMAGKSAVALRYAWRASRIGFTDKLERELPRLERLYLDELMKHQDPVEGLTSFIERREPRWTNR